MNTRFPIARWVIRINLWCGLASGFALLAMMLMGALDVIGSNLDLAGLTARPIPAAFEFMATMMVVNVFLAMSLGQARRRHIRVEIVLNVLPGRLRRAVEAFSLCAPSPCSRSSRGSAGSPGCTPPGSASTRRASSTIPSGPPVWSLRSGRR